MRDGSTHLSCCYCAIVLAALPQQALRIRCNTDNDTFEATRALNATLPALPGHPVLKTDNGGTDAANNRQRQAFNNNAGKLQAESSTRPLTRKPLWWVLQSAVLSPELPRQHLPCR